MTCRTGPGRRVGFTLVELLIVIAIIAVLAALTIAAVSRARGVGQRTTAVSEINQLDAAAASFKLKFGFYPPSHVVWNDPTAATPPNPPLTVRVQIPTKVDRTDKSFPTLLILRRMFPRWRPCIDAMNNPLPEPIPDGTAITNPLPLAGEILDPNQAMVYFLGGPQQNGWLTDQPQDPGTSGAKITQFYEFPQGRLVKPKSFGANPPSTMAFQYTDPWGTPYAYFSSGPGGDAYNPLVQFPWNTNSASNAAPDSYNPGSFSLTPAAKNDPNSPATFTAHPYMGSNGKWLNPGKVQIVSAGVDKMFGPGSPKTSATSTAPSPLPLDAPSTFNSPFILPWIPEKGYYVSGSLASGDNRGDDDMGNFNSGIILGTLAQ